MFKSWLSNCLTVLFVFVLTQNTVIGQIESTKPTGDSFVTTVPAPNPDAWWTERHAKKLADLKNTKSVDLLWIGDSITHSWEGSGKDVWDEFYAKRNPFNIGYSGDRTENVLWRLENGEIDGIQPKLIVMMIGTNNTGHRQDPSEQTVAGIKAILGRLRHRMAESKILLLGVFPRGENASDRLRVLNDQINTQLPTLADEEHIFFLDIGPAFLENKQSTYKELMPDLLHPNKAGYEVWAKAIEDKIVKLMGE